jgi:hypothetical protein
MAAGIKKAIMPMVKQAVEEVEMIDRAFNLILQEVDSSEGLVRSCRVLTCRWQDTVRLLKVVDGLREVTC